MCLSPQGLRRLPRLLISVRQSKTFCASIDSIRPSGLRITLTCSPSGAQTFAFVGPNKAIVGVPTAAARWVTPVSCPTKTRAFVHRLAQVRQTRVEKGFETAQPATRTKFANQFDRPPRRRPGENRRKNHQVAESVPSIDRSANSFAENRCPRENRAWRTELVFGPTANLGTGSRRVNPSGPSTLAKWKTA